MLCPKCNRHAISLLKFVLMFDTLTITCSGLPGRIRPVLMITASGSPATFITGPWENVSLPSKISS